MFPINTPSATPDKKFTEGSPAGGVPATTVSATWLNTIQAEILNVLADRGIDPSETDQAQLLQAINALIADEIPGFTPVEQGGGVGMGLNKVRIGFSAASTLIAQVDSTALGSFLFASPGDVVITTGSIAPPGTMKMNAAPVSRTTYAALFSVIGTTYGAGDGSTTFNLPDGRAEVIRGLDDGRGVDPGRVIGSFQKGSLAAFDPTTISPVAAGLHSNGADATILQDLGFDAVGGISYPGADVPYVASGGILPAAGATGVTRMRNIAFLFCIRY